MDGAQKSYYENEIIQLSQLNEKAKKEIEKLLAILDDKKLANDKLKSQVIKFIFILLKSKLILNR